MVRYRYDGIQALRFLAAIMVVIYHSFFYASERLGVEKIAWGNGAKGVDIFFVISGFVMVISSKKLINISDGWKIFIKKRLIRIVPLYWIATTVKLVVILLTSSIVLYAKLDWFVIFKSYLFIPSLLPDGSIKPFFGVGWTLCFEIFFYIIFMFALLVKHNLMQTVGSILMFCSLLFLFRSENSSAIWFFADPLLIEFYFGMIIGYLALNDKVKYSFWSFIVLAVVLPILLFSYNNYNLPRLIYVGVPSALLVWSVVSIENFLQGKIPKFIMFYGAASYALYLFHPLTAPLAPELLKKINILNFNFSVMLSICIALVISASVHLFVELPLTRVIYKKFF